MGESTVNEIIESFRRARNILVTAHKDPDGDSLGSQLVMRSYLTSLGKNVLICNEGEIPPRYMFLDSIESVKTDCEDTGFDPDLALVLESTTLDRIGNVASLIPPGCKIINVDHHVGNSLYGDLNLVDENASSVAEVLYRVLKADRFEFDKSAAESLYTAILTDTGRFRFSSTTSNSMRICADMLDAGADPRELSDKIYFSKSRDQIQVLGEVMQSCEVLLNGRLCFMTLTREALARKGLNFSDFEGIVDYSMYVRDTVIGALFKDISADVTKVSLRSRNSFDVSVLARKFGGGGHVNAAGATIGLPLDQARQVLLRAVEEMLGRYED